MASRFDRNIFFSSKAWLVLLQCWIVHGLYVLLFRGQRRLRLNKGRRTAKAKICVVGETWQERLSFFFVQCISIRNKGFENTDSVHNANRDNQDQAYRLNTEKEGSRRAPRLPRLRGLHQRRRYWNTARSKTWPCLVTSPYPPASLLRRPHSWNPRLPRWP